MPTTMTGPEVQSELTITAAELQRWIVAGRVPVVGNKTIRKRGSSYSTTLHDPDIIATLTRAVIQKWRDQDDLEFQQERVRQEKALHEQKSIADAGFNLTENHWYAQRTLHIASPWGELPLSCFIPIGPAANVGKRTTLVQLEGLLQQATAANQPAWTLLLSKTLMKHAALARELSLIDQYDLLSHLEAAVNLKPLYLNERPEKALLTHLRAAIRVTGQEKVNQEVHRRLDLDNYAASFPLARSMRRKIIQHIGPPNSGKTHTAIEALKAAKSGVYLAPLRLLAMEVFDRLVAAGVPCELHTGEEHIIQPNARVICSTVEMLRVDYAVEVAVIDEMQMLFDTDRGWAWTAALLGVPAKTVYLLGSAYAQPMIDRVLMQTGESNQVEVFERKSVLEIGSVPCRMQEIVPGDAVIAFSRRGVLQYAAQLKDLGRTVSVIYGALAPEVRRAQAQRFLTGDAEVVVSTDAIGMGLNLPVRRVVFTTTVKYDGKKERQLTPSELAQIAGRAGRFGLVESGMATAMSPGDIQYLQHTLPKPLPPVQQALAIAPTPWHVETLAAVLNTENLVEILHHFVTHVSLNNPLYKVASLTEVIRLAYWADERLSAFSLRTRFSYACAPVTPDHELEINYYLNGMLQHSRGQQTVLPRLPEWIYQAPRPLYLQEAEKLSKQISIYAWLSFKFPEQYPDGDLIAGQRSLVADYIDRILWSRKKQPKNAKMELPFGDFPKKAELV